MLSIINDFKEQAEKGFAPFLEKISFSLMKKDNISLFGQNNSGDIAIVLMLI
ncbi:hypothetical protein PZE06_01530 [Robertmurraya sp. DFI.2.37]|uniref:hypothetical protein n=1 Tax=Robertmurraya sp. DFI.2.37 TaxID=3031819 RepID=UPI00177EC833|nr:hypothetical protein [Robertmurraya sp. DFI.2.37]MDF1506855.1 hypothetical protein [Robertmurraya sp. DFI.2.37]